MLSRPQKARRVEPAAAPDRKLLQTTFKILEYPLCGHTPLFVDQESFSIIQGLLGPIAWRGNAGFFHTKKGAHGELGRKRALLGTSLACAWRHRAWGLADFCWEGFALHGVPRRPTLCIYACYRMENEPTHPLGQLLLGRNLELIRESNI